MKNEYSDFYGIYTELINNSEKEIMKKLHEIINELTNDPENNPAEHILSRIKRPDSLCEKLKKDGLPETPETAIKNISDIIGIRIVTHFVGDVYKISRKIEECSYWKIIKKKDYIEAPKPNGYRSLHIIILPNDSDIRAEIQLRTIAMDCWASLEHQMKYKKNIGKNTELIVSELKRCADEIASTDLSMQTLREMIEKDR